MKVSIYHPYTKQTETFQGSEEEVLKELVDAHPYLRYRCENIDEAFKELSRCQANFVTVEE
jgi:hypothetical protein